jgi:hypothetical protein
MKNQNNETRDFFKSCFGNILIIALLFLLAGYLWSLSQDKEEPIEYARYEVNYIHISGEQRTKYLNLDAEGISLALGFCKGNYFIFQDRHQNKADCNVQPLIYGATDIVSFKKVK